MIRIAHLIAFALLLASPKGQAQDPPTAADVARYAQAQLAEQFKADEPGLALLIARGDKVLYRGARGLASVELNVPLSPDHIFRIGSVTKQFSAAALLKLVDQGKVALDDPLSKFLPDYPNGENITVAQLLNHTSGIKSYTDIPGYMDQEVRRDLDTSGMIAVFKDQPVDFAPGERWSYNNSGYVLVGAVIEKVTGMTWDRWVMQSLIEPLALEHTRSGVTRDVIPLHATGYSFGGGSLATAAVFSMTQPHAAGALVSTADDLWRWNRALHGGKAISADSYRRMTTPEGAAADGPSPYGYGIQRGTVRGRTTYEHGGGIFGFLSQLVYVPESQITVVALRNADGRGGNEMGMIVRKVTAFALGDPYPDAKPVKMSEEELEALEGVYRFEDGSTRTLRVKDGVLISQRSGGAPLKLIPIGDDTFAFENSLTYLTIERDAENQPVAVRLFADGEGDGQRWPRTDETVAERPSIELSRAALARFVGDYASPQLTFKIFFDDADVLRVQVPGQPAFALKAETPSRLFITEVDASFEFEPAEGPVQTATLVQGPARIVVEREAD